MPPLPEQIDDYRILRRLGSGGMGTVHLAEHVTLGRRVALKLLAPELGDDPAFRERFVREARLAARLEHPNVVTVYDAGSADAGLWLAMRYVDGEDLGARLRRVGGPLPPAEAVAIVEQVAAALDHAHGQGLVHRDVKPANVLLESDGRALLTDFGLTKELDGTRELTRTGAVLGSIDYMAPEQIEGGEIGPWTDVYALTATLVAALTGAPAYEGSTAGRLYAHVNAPPPRLAERRPELAPFDAVVAHGMAKDPADRPASAGALAARARRALADQPTVAQDAPTRALPPPAADEDATHVALPRPTPPAGAAPRPRPRDRPEEDDAVAGSSEGDVAGGTLVRPPAGPGPVAAGARRAVAPPDDPSRRPAPRWAVVVLGLLAVGLVATVVLILTGGADERPRAVATRTADGSDGEEAGAGTTTDATATGTATATGEQPPAAGGTAGGAEDPAPVAGGGTIAPAAGEPLPAGGEPASYADPSGSWRTLLARPRGGWGAPARTSEAGGRRFRLRQAGPDGRLILVDHTPALPATFEARPGDERRPIAGTAFGAVEGYGFRGRRLVGVPECRRSFCVDVPLNAGPGGPGWGVLVAAPTPDEAWATATRVAVATGP